VHTQLLDAGFSALLEHKLVAGVFDNTSTSTTISTDPLDGMGASLSRAVLLPKILSVLTRQAHAIGHGMPNEYLQAMEAVPDLEGFAAVVYSSNWQAEIVPDDGGGVSADVAKEQVPSPGSSRVAAHQHGEGHVHHGQGGMGESSMVIVDKTGGEEGSSLFDSVWEKASASK
jgi:peroxin-3